MARMSTLCHRSVLLASYINYGNTLAPALRETGASFRGKGTTGPTCNQLRRVPFVAVVQATDRGISTICPASGPCTVRVVGVSLAKER